MLKKAPQLKLLSMLNEFYFHAKWNELNAGLAHFGNCLSKLYINSYWKVMLFWMNPFNFFFIF
jgi:hypothetical protein